MTEGRKSPTRSSEDEVQLSSLMVDINGNGVAILSAEYFWLKSKSPGNDIRDCLPDKEVVGAPLPVHLLHVLHHVLKGLHFVLLCLILFFLFAELFENDVFFLLSFSRSLFLLQLSQLLDFCIELDHSSNLCFSVKEVSNICLEI